MPKLSSSAKRKRDAWATRENTDRYIAQIGPYAAARDAKVIAEMLGSGPGQLLDMPCGTGRFLELEKQLGYQVTAADYSPTMMAVARQNHPDVAFVQADAFNPPFKPDSFDVILISRLLFHYDRPERIISALLPSLRKGGRMLFDTLNPLSLRWWASKVLGLFRRDPARHLYFERRGRFARTLAGLGLEVVRRRSAYFFPTRFYRFIPGALWWLARSLEAITIPQLRVLTYWSVRKVQHPTLP